MVYDASAHLTDARLIANIQNIGGMLLWLLPEEVSSAFIHSDKTNYSYISYDATIYKKERERDLKQEIGRLLSARPPEFIQNVTCSS